MTGRAGVPALEVDLEPRQEAGIDPPQPLQGHPLEVSDVQLAQASVGYERDASRRGYSPGGLPGPAQI